MEKSLFNLTIKTAGQHYLAELSHPDSRLVCRLETVYVFIRIVVRRLRDVVLAGLGRPPRHPKRDRDGWNHAPVSVGRESVRAYLRIHVLQDARIGVVTW